MRFLRFLPFAAVLVAAAPAAQPPTKDLVRRDAKPCTSEEKHSEKGCYAATGKYEYTRNDVEGVVVYDVKFEGTIDYYQVSFSAYNPNTDVFTPCKAGAKDAIQFQHCERVRTAFKISTDDVEITTREKVSVHLKVVWMYAEGALPRAMEKKKGGNGNEDEYKDLVYYQVGELEFEATCTKDEKTTIHDSSNDDDMVCDDDGVCFAPDEGSDEDEGTIKKETHVSCHFKGELTVVTGVLKKGEWDGKDE